MLLPTAFYPHAQCIAKHLPHLRLRPGQVRGLALWVGATILARSGRWNAVLGVLLTLGFGWHATRQYLREWLRDGADRAAPCRVQLDVQACFAPLLRWVLAWWQGTELTLAVDPTAKGSELVALVVSVVYRGLAIPVAWRIRTGGQPGPARPVGPAGAGHAPGHDRARALRPGPVESRPVGRHPPPRLASLHAPCPQHDLPGDHRPPRAGLALRGPRRAVHGDGRAGLPRPQAVLHLAVAYGPRREQARARGLRPGQLRRPPTDAPPKPPAPRRFSLLRQGAACLRRLLARNRLWARVG